MLIKFSSIYSKISVTTLLMVAFMLPTFSASAAYFNTASNDYPTLQVKNYTKNSTCSSCWSTSVSADAGDVISFFVFYHNTSAETANNVMAKVILPTASFASQSITGSVWADNALPRTNSINLNISSNQTLTYIPGSLQWRPGGVNTQSLSNSDNIVLNGVNVGNVVGYQFGNNFDDLGYITFRAQVSSNSNNNNNNGQTPIVTTSATTNITQTSATFNATVNPNNSFTTVQFQYGTTQSLGNSTPFQNIGSGSSNINVIDSSLASLQPNTTYYYRIVASNTAGTSNGNILNFTTSAQNGGGQQGQVPAVTTNNATNISQNFATLNASVNPNSSNTTVWFEYGTSQSLGSTIGSQTIGSGNSTQSMASYLSNLSLNTTYYYRIVATNSTGTSNGSILSFTTSGSSSQGQAPTVSTNSATNIGSNYMTLNGTVNTNNLPTTVWFEYGQTTSLGYISGNQTVNAANYSQNINAYLSNIQPNTTYYYRIVASNSYGTMQGGILNSTTQGSGYNNGNNNNYAPFVTTSYAFNLGQNSATLSGAVNPNNSYATAWFEYGTTNLLGYTASSQLAGSGSYSQNITTSITGLQSNTTYYYRIVAQNSYGTVYGSILSFTTSGSNNNLIYNGVSGAPFVVTVPTTFIYQNSALLNGTSNPNGSLATAWFEWGLTSSFGNATNPSNIGQGTAGLLYSYALTGLQSNTTYYYRAVSQNSYGTTYGNISNFTTAGNSVYSASTDQPNIYIQTPATSGTQLSNGIISLTPAIDNSNPSSGEEVSYTLVYRNNSKNPVTNASLKIILPNEVKYEVSNSQPTSIAGNSLTFDLGNINSQTQGILSIKSKISDSTKAGSALVFSSTINYTDSNNKQSSIDAYLTAIVKAGGVVTASLIDVMGSIFSSWFFDILLGLIIGFGGYHFFIKSKEGDLVG